jgi:hypothetical protein
MRPHVQWQPMAQCMHALADTSQRADAPLPPEPSQWRRPEPMVPSPRLSHRLSVAPVKSHFQSSGLIETLRSAGSCSRLAAYLLSLRSSSQVAVSSCRPAPSLPCRVGGVRVHQGAAAQATGVWCGLIFRHVALLY